MVPPPGAPGPERNRVRNPALSPGATTTLPPGLHSAAVRGSVQFVVQRNSSAAARCGERGRLHFFRSAMPCHGQACFMTVPAFLSQALPNTACNDRICFRHLWTNRVAATCTGDKRPQRPAPRENKGDERDNPVQRTRFSDPAGERACDPPACRPGVAPCRLRTEMTVRRCSRRHATPTGCLRPRAATYPRFARWRGLRKPRCRPCCFSTWPPANATPTRCPS